MKKLLLTTAAMLSAVMLFASGCSNSDCNTSYGGTPVPVPTPTPTPEPVARGFVYQGQYNMPPGIALSPLSQVQADDPNSRGSNEFLYLSAINRENIYDYDIIRLNLASAIFGTELIGEILQTYEWGYEAFGFYKIPGENSFYAFDNALYGGKYLNIASNGDKTEEDLWDEDDLFTFYFRPETGLMYTMCYYEDYIWIFQKTGEGAAATHEILEEIGIYDLIGEELDSADDYGLGGLIADENGNMYLGYWLAAGVEPAFNAKGPSFDAYNIEYKIARIIESEDGYVLDTIWTVASLANIPAGNNFDSRLAWGPDGTIIFTAPAVDRVKLLNTADGSVSDLVIPEAQIGQAVHYLSASYNPTTSNLYLLAAAGAVPGWDGSGEYTPVIYTYHFNP